MSSKPIKINAPADIRRRVEDLAATNRRSISLQGLLLVEAGLLALAGEDRAANAPKQQVGS